MASIAHKRPRPAALVVVALLFLLGGLAPFIGGSHVSTAGIGIFELVIGIGLLARKALARQVALARARSWR